MEKKLLNLFNETTIPPTPPLWLMRQAGRYLPEYRALRAKADGFLNLCLTPKLAEEATLQPIRRYDFDAAILFADILIVPYALGQNLAFIEGEGPRLDPINTIADLTTEHFNEKISPILETISRLKTSLPPKTTLIGFAGAPWTLATYMVFGRGSKTHKEAKQFAGSHPQAFADIINLLVDATIDYLSAQADAGAEVLQIFDSWAGALPPADFEQWCLQPMADIIKGLRARAINIPIIAFPRAMRYGAQDYINHTHCTALGLDTHTPRQDTLTTTATTTILQGNLDPQTLCTGGAPLDAAIDAILNDFDGKRFIFNLGHGILPQTPPAHVAQLVARVRQSR